MIKYLVVFAICAIVLAVGIMIYAVLVDDCQQQEEKKGDDTHDHTG